MTRATVTADMRQRRRALADDQVARPGAILLVAGPNVQPELLRRHCISVLSAGRDLELLRLGPTTISERSLLRALARWYGSAHVQLVQNHSDWVALPHDRTVVVLSDRGFWCGEEQVADLDTMRQMSHAALGEIYGLRP